MPESPAPAPESTPTQPTPAAAPATAEPTAPSTDASPPPTETARAEPAKSPTAPMDVHAELMKVATAAIKKPAREEPSPSTSQDNGKGPKPSEASDPKRSAAEVPAPAAAAAKPDGKADPAKDDPDDETKPPPFHHDKRWKKLTADYQATVQERDQLKGPAEQFGKIMDYMRHFDITADDMVVAYDLIARIKHDPISAFEKLTPIYEDLAKRAGRVLPDDLQKRVDEGYMDEQSARELAQARVREKLANDGTARERRTLEQTQASQSVERNRTAAASWEASIIAKDPDFERKRSAVQDAARAIISVEGQPKSPEQAVSILDRAYKRVNDMLAGYAPRPNATPPKPNGAASPSTAAVTAAPKSLLEAAQQGLDGRYRYSS